MKYSRVRAVWVFAMSRPWWLAIVNALWSCTIVLSLKVRPIQDRLRGFEHVFVRSISHLDKAMQKCCISYTTSVLLFLKTSVS